MHCGRIIFVDCHAGPGGVCAQLVLSDAGVVAGHVLSHLEHGQADLVATHLGPVLGTLGKVFAIELKPDRKSVTKIGQEMMRFTP